MLQKNTWWILAAGILVIVVGGTYYFLFTAARGPLQKQGGEKTMLQLGEDLAPIELSAEERAALAQEGLSLPEGADTLAQNLQRVHSGDDLNTIEKDLNETNLTGLDSELDAIDKDLHGM